MHANPPRAPRACAALHSTRRQPTGNIHNLRARRRRRIAWLRNLAAAVSAAALAARGASAQCYTASVEAYDATPSNPVALLSSWPQQYPVLCASFHVEAQGADPGGFGLLAVSTAPALPPLPLPPPIDGALLVNLNGAKLFPYVLNPSWTFALPCSTPPGIHAWLQSAHSTSSGGFELSNGLHAITGYHQAELAVTDLDVPTTLVGGVGPKSYSVTVHNSGNAPASASVTCTIGSNSATVPVTVQPFSDATVTILLLTPPAFGSCGGSTPYTVTACVNFADCQPSNNCLSTSAQVAVPYWDLDFDIVDAPGSASKCSSIGWTVKVTNKGNVPSDSVCFLTAINCTPGAGAYGCLAGPLFGAPPFGALWTGSVAPEDSHYIDIFNYGISCAAFTQTQYIKAEVNYSAGCFDHCGGSNNFAQAAISIF